MMLYVEERRSYSRRRLSRSRKWALKSLALPVSMDAAGEFTPAEFLSELDKRKISYRLKKPRREQKNALGMIDTAVPE